MEQLHHIGEALGGLKAMLVFRDEIQINQRQCCLLAESYNLAFDAITEEIRYTVRFDEKNTKWSALENPLKELLRIIKEGKQYIRQCLEPKDWWAKAISLNQNLDCVGFHLHNLLWCVSVVHEAIENAGEISGCDHEGINKVRLLLTKKYEREWMDPKLFQIKFGKSYLVTRELCSRMDSVAKEDHWLLSEAIAEKRKSLTRHESQLAELLLAPRGRLFPSSILLGSKDYQVRRRLGGSGEQYKEILWMGESFALRHFFGDIVPLLQEISLLSSIAHPNVMHYMYAFSDEERKQCCLVMELMNKDLSSHIKEVCCSRRRIPFPLLVAVDIMLQIARGMEYLHSQKIYHGDLNPSNILLRSRNSSPEGYLHVKVTGFGISNGKSSKGTINYPCIWYAPEVLAEQEQQSVSNSSKYSEKADVYSFGMICFELLTGKIPFDDDHMHGEKMSRNIRAGERPLFTCPSPKDLTVLTKRCWQADPQQRPCFSSICRLLRYTKRFLIMNTDHNLPDLPCPSTDYFEIEMSLLKRFAKGESIKVSEIPFQMFAYRVVEREKRAKREKATEDLKERGSDSGSEDAPNYGDETVFSLMAQDDSCPSPSPLHSPSPLPSSLPSTSSFPKSFSHTSTDNYARSSPRKIDGKTNKQSGQSLSGRASRPPQLMSLRARSLRDHTLLPSPVASSPGRMRSSGHLSDSELA